jgi:hypothetical protein
MVTIMSDDAWDWSGVEMHDVTFKVNKDMIKEEIINKYINTLIV